jgi:hypothetical protein
VMIDKIILTVATMALVAMAALVFTMLVHG